MTDKTGDAPWGKIIVVSGHGDLLGLSLDAGLKLTATLALGEPGPGWLLEGAGVRGHVRALRWPLAPPGASLSLGGSPRFLRAGRVVSGGPGLID